MSAYSHHPAANLFPELTGDELAELRTGYRLNDDHGLLLVEIAPATDVGYWHIAIFLRPAGDVIGTRRPVIAEAVNLYVHTLLSRELPVVTAADWQPFSQSPVSEAPYCGHPTVKPYDGDVYLIGVDPGGLVKIGVSVNPHARLAQIQLMSPVRLEVLATIPCGGYDMETRLHQRFAKDRSHGEWFHPSADLFAEFGVQW